jgi:pectate lyase
VTYHHNYWSNINSRTPSLRFGTGHIYSSCYENIPTSGVNSRMGAQVLVEQCAFTNVKNAIMTNLDSDEPGKAIQRNNVFSNSNIDITQTGSYSVPYSYT